MVMADVVMVHNRDGTLLKQAKLVNQRRRRQDLGTLVVLNRCTAWSGHLFLGISTRRVKVMMTRPTPKLAKFPTPSRTRTNLLVDMLPRVMVMVGFDSLWATTAGGMSAGTALIIAFPVIFLELSSPATTR